MWYSPVSLAVSIKSIRFHPPPKSQDFPSHQTVHKCKQLFVLKASLLVMLNALNSVLWFRVVRVLSQGPLSHTSVFICLQEAAPPPISDLSPTSGQHYLGSVDVSSCPPWLDPLTQLGQEERESRVRRLYHSREVSCRASNLFLSCGKVPKIALKTTKTSPRREHVSQCFLNAS